jgi:hypothetical protein
LVVVASPPFGLLVSVPLIIAVVSAFGAIGACGMGLIDVALDGNGTALGAEAALVALAIIAGTLVRPAHRRQATRAAVACPICRTGTLQMRMVAIS